MTRSTITGHAKRGVGQAIAALILPFDQRTRSRQLAQLSNGEEISLMLERGLVLRGGDRLLTDDGRVVEVISAPEAVSTVTTTDPRQLARASYHLGNRHVAVQIGADWLRYRHDRVLDEMLRGQGFTVVIEDAPFEPESGAYAAAGHGHAHG